MIIFLNGVSSSGKTSLGRALQYLSDRPLLLTGIDTFLTMMPKGYLEFTPKASERKDSDLPGHVHEVHPETFGDRVMKVIAPVVAALSVAGIDTIVDEVVVDDDALRSYVHVLKDYTVYFVGVHCNLELLEEREILRGDRDIGLSRDQINRVHAPRLTRMYDVTVDTTYASPFACARHILEFINKNPFPAGFKKLQEVLP